MLIIHAYLIWGVLSPTVQAIPVFNLYDSTQQVVDQSAGQRQQAQAQAFAEVIVRVTGSALSLQHPMVMTAGTDAAQYLLEYSYTSVDQQGQKPMGLYFRFDQLAVNALLEQAGLSIWGEERAVVLAWLVLEEQGQRRLVTLHDHLSMDMLVEHSQRRGMPLITPLLDLEDQSRLPVADLWLLLKEPIMAASARYQPAGILIGRLLQDDLQRWVVNWSFWFQGKELQWQNQSFDLQPLVAEATDRVATEVAQVYAVSTRSRTSQELDLLVDGVAELAEYAALQRLLLDLANVTGLQVRQIDGRQVQLRLQTQGSRQQLRAALALERRLRINHTANTTVDPVGQWYYSWRD